MLKAYAKDEEANEYYELVKNDNNVYYIVVSSKGEIELFKLREPEANDTHDLINHFKANYRAISLQRIFVRDDREIITQTRLIKLFNSKSLDRFLDESVASEWRF